MSGFSYDFPYPSQRMPILAKNIVSTSQPLAAQAGLRMLLKGGNAVDAAIATAIALTVVEPTSNGIGSDAFSIVWDGTKLHGLNASGRSPAALTPEKFDGQAEMSPLGWNTVTVPGAVSAWVALSEKFGKLPFYDLFEPAIDYAGNGYIVSPITANGWAGAKNTYRDFPEFARAFLPGGNAPKPGEKFVFKDQAQTLCRIAATKGEAFYRGDLAEKIVAYAKATDGLMTLEDLDNHRPDWVEPLSMDYHGITLHEIPPNGQGIAALIMLGMIKHLNVQDYPPDSADSLHIQIEAMKLAFADAHRYVSDPKFMDVEMHALLDPDYLAERAALIDKKTAKNPNYGMPPKGGTVYLTAADEDGMMVSYIQSNFGGFGSGIVIPGTGISMQNRGYGFTLEKGHPNQVEGRKRPYHTIIPGFVTQNGNPLMSFGVMGGPMQPQGHSQMIFRIFDYNQNPQTASDAPRWRVLQDFNVAIEPGIDASVLDNLTARGHKIQIGGTSFGGAQLIYKLKNGYCAGSDHRKDGQAVGF
ncbi:MAG: gamma-glutamyltransferase family protein [Candidatus Latescibacteria bacterium]|nr:gamma-glutamyltransferase family protein [Candidatus Latescibacterota bacterium]